MRSLYVKRIRNTPDEVLSSFDAPQGFDSAPDRQNTTTATQSLLLANSAWPIARARAFAKRLLGGRTEVSADDLIRAYFIAWGRMPSDEEVAAAQEFVAAQGVEFAKVKPKPPTNPDKFPNENGLRPIAQRFAGVEGVPLGGKALWLQPGSRFERLQIDELPSLGDAFTIEAVVQLDAGNGGSAVSTIASRWDGVRSKPGWALGVTGDGSTFGPRNLVIELNGPNADGAVRWEAVASGLRLPLGKPVYVAVMVEFDKDGRGHARFALKDLTQPELAPLTAQVGHRVTRNDSAEGMKVVVGGRVAKGLHWDGQIASFSVSSTALPNERLKVFGDSEGEGTGRIVDWTFSGENGEQPAPGARWLRDKPKTPPQKPPSPALAALADFCHALLSSNEFLYLH